MGGEKVRRALEPTGHDLAVAVDELDQLDLRLPHDERLEGRDDIPEVMADLDVLAMPSVEPEST